MHAAVSLTALAQGTSGEAPSAASDTQAAPSPRAFIEVDTPGANVWLGETVPVRLRFGFEREFLERGLVQLFQRPLDVPAQVHASWIEGSSCAERSAAAGAQPEDDAGSAGFALGDGAARARRAPDEVRDGATFRVFELERAFVALCPGPWTLEAPTLRFAYATRFRVNAFGELVAEDRRDATVTTEVLAFDVRPLPEEGRPPGFTGAVGRFEARASLSPLPEHPSSLKLELAISGAGDVSRFEVPRFPQVQGLRAQGWTDVMRGATRVITYDLAWRSDLPVEIPALEFSYFDPESPGSYRTAHTDPILLEPTLAREATEPRGSIGWRVAAALGALTTAGLFAFLLWRRRAQAGDPGVLDEDLESAAAREASALAARAPGDRAQALAEYLASRLDCPVPAVIGPGLAERLELAGVPSAGAASAAQLLDELVAARYGGAEAPDASARVRASIEALELAFRRAARRP